MILILYVCKYRIKYCTDAIAVVIALFIRDKNRVFYLHLVFSVNSQCQNLQKLMPHKHLQFDCICINEKFVFPTQKCFIFHLGQPLYKVCFTHNVQWRSNGSILNFIHGFVVFSSTNTF